MIYGNDRSERFEALMRVELGLECCVDCTAIDDLVSVNQIYEDVEFSSLKPLKKPFIAPFAVSTGRKTAYLSVYHALRIITSSIMIAGIGLRRRSY